jgi:hypothetical protein
MTATTPDNEKAILPAAIKALEAETGLRMEIEKENARIEGRLVDALLKLPGVPASFAVEVKKWAPHTNLDALIYQILRLPVPNGHRMLVADYINPQMAERLKAEGIQFLDTVGNGYINAPPIYVYVKGQGRALRAAAPKGNRAFEPKGLKVIFAFLCNPHLVNAPYRTIADLAGVALGTVGWVVTGLKDAGLLVERGKQKGRHMTNYQKLLDRWVAEYPQKLKPKQLVGNFVADDPCWWEDFDITNYGALFGGEIAATKLTNYLKPKIATVYTQEAFKSQLFAKARFRKADDLRGDTPVISVYRQFWNDGDWHHAFAHLDKKLPQDIVHPVLIYADLIATGDARNRETAEIIYEQYLARYFREN